MDEKINKKLYREELILINKKKKGKKQIVDTEIKVEKIWSR